MKKSTGLTVSQRLERLSIPVTETGCWLWIGALVGNGYGGIMMKGGIRLAHRISWEQINGPVPCGMHICHKCDTKLCINPSHLFIGTRSDNMRDMVTKGRNIHPDGRGKKNPMSKLTDEKVIAIREDRRRQQAIAADYGIRQSAVSRIKTGARWAHI